MYKTTHILSGSDMFTVGDVKYDQEGHLLT